MDDPALSIVIVSYNTQDLLAECLESLRAGPPAQPHEVIVVDNASMDESVEMLAKRFPRAVCLAGAENLGFAAACNRGVAEARGRRVLFLNPDTRVTPGALDAMTAFLDDNPDVGVLGCRQVDDRGWPHLCYGRSPTLAAERARRQETRGLARGDEAIRKRVDERYTQPADVDWVTGACMMVPRPLYARLGGMDEAMWLYFEDVDLCRRVREAGRRVVYHPGITIYHRRDAAMSAVRPIADAAYRVSQLRYVRLHRGPVCALGLRLRYLAMGLLGWSQWFVWLAGVETHWISGQLVRLALFGKPSADWRRGPMELRHRLPAR